MFSPLSVLRIKPLAVVAAAAVAANTVALVGLHLAFPNLSFLPGHPAAATHSTPTPGRPVAQRSGPLPAETALAAVFAAPPTALPGTGWQPGSDPGGAIGTPFDAACPTPGGPAAMTVKARGWSQVNGPLPSNLLGAITVSMRAYAAGGGALAFQNLKAAATACAAVSVADRPGLGVEALAGRTGQASVLVWRRGDVLAVLTYQTKGVPGDLAAVSSLADEYDQRLATALAGVCVNEKSTAADATRNPYLDRAAFTGYTVPHTVILDQKAAEDALPSSVVSPVPTPLPSPTATLTTAPASGTAQPSATTSAPVTVVPVSIPGPAIPLPTLDKLPTPPPGVTASTLPTPVAKPTVPPAPAEASTTVEVPEQQADPKGPGCGWAFTGQAAPPFTATGAEQKFSAAQAAAQDKLQSAWVKWLNDRDAYYTAYAVYQQQADAYIAYVTQVQEVAAAWASADAAQKTYQQALTDYQAALAARAKFLSDQQTAQAAYDADVTACQTASPTGTPTGSPTGTPTGTPTGSPTGIPTGSPTAAPSPTCPAPRPAILDQTPPPAPTPPTPPAQPSPSR